MFQQTQKEEFTALQDEIKEQNRYSQGFGKEVLGDVGFMTRFETDHRTGLTGEVGGVTAELTGVQADIEAQQGVVEGSRTAWQTAFEAFEAAPGKETGDALALAEDAFNAEKANLQHLKAMEQLYSRKLTLLEAGIQTSENASAASKIIAEQLELQAQALAARQSAGMLADTFDIIGEGRQDLREEGRFSLKGYASVSPDITMLSDVREWAASSREMLGEDRIATELRLGGVEPELDERKTELSDLRDQLKEEMGKDEPDAALIGKLSAEIENKQKMVDTQQKIVDDYKAQLEKINAQLENIQKQVDAHKDAIGTKIAEQSYAASVRDIKDDETTMKELLKTPYADYTDEQKADLQKFLQADQGDAIPEHVEGFKESFIVAQAKEAMSGASMVERYEDMSLEQLQAQLDPETGEFVGLSGKQEKLADARLKEVISPEDFIALHEQRQAAFAQTPEGVLKQTLKDRAEQEREAKRQQRLAERRHEYAERQELREDKRHIDMLAKPIVSLPGRFIDAYDKRGMIDQRGRERLSDLREGVGEQKRDVMEDATLTIRQRQQQIERIEKESAKRRIQIEKDIAEAKKKAFADVLNSFKNMFRDMLIRETEYMAQSAIREWWLGRQGWENDQMGGYQRATPVGGGSFPISVNIPTGNAPVRSDTGRTYVGSPTGATGGGQVVLPMGPMAAGDGGQPVRSPAAVGSGAGNDGRFYAKDGRIFPDEESYKRQMEKEGQPDRGGGFDIARNLFTLGTHQLAEEHLWSRWDDPDTGDRPWWATAGQWGQDYLVSEYVSKPVVGFAWDAIKSGGSSAADWGKGLFSGGEQVAQLADVSTIGGEAVSSISSLPPELTQVADVSFQPVSTASGLPSELTQVADVNFEPVTRGISDATKAGIKEGIKQVDTEPLKNVVAEGGKEGAQGFWQGIMDNPAVEIGGDALSLHSLFKATGHLGRDADSREARMGQEVNPYNILIDEIFGETWGELGGNLWQGAKNVGGFGKELGGGMWDFAKDIGGFVSDIPGTLNRTSGTGNWFTQTAKDVGGFFGDTFGKDSWRSVTDLFGGMGDWFSFDHPVNDAIARRAGARYAQQQALPATASRSRQRSRPL